MSEPVRIPDALAAAGERGEPWASWLDALPRLASEVLAEWELTLDRLPGAGFASGATALVLPVRDSSGLALVLKLTLIEDDNVVSMAMFQALGYTKHPEIVYFAKRKFPGI